MRLGLTVTRMLMAGLLGDGDGDVSLRDVSPRDISLYRAFAKARDFIRNRMRKQPVTFNSNTFDYYRLIYDSTLLYAIAAWLKVI